MITATINSEFGKYLQDFNHGYPVHTSYYCIDAYRETGKDWLSCPCCGLKPRMWAFDNGRSTACGCGFNRYDHFSVCAESIMSVFSRCGGFQEYDGDQLKRNWNEYCQTTISPCSHGDLFIKGKW